jgi:thiamine-phosphate pyrophosphorylase
MKFPHRGLYAITQTADKSIRQILSEVEAVLKGGALVLQYRDKVSADKKVLASLLVKLCHAYQVPLLINDDVELALLVGADGVHLGKDDGDIAIARQLLGPDAIIGISCYNNVDHALSMQAQGADYVAFGRFFPSNSKPLAAPAQIETLQKAKQLLHIPLVAIGGILPENADVLLAAGADLLAVIGGVFDKPDPEVAAREYQRYFA